MDIKGMQKHKEQNVQNEDSGIVNIRIGYEFFQKSVNDYSNPIPWIWAREIIQNSVDANSTEIDFTVDENTVTASDNGHGMDANIIINKFLTLGASQKNATGTDDELAVGGFGKAKEVVCFAWRFWSIDSRPTKTERYYVDSEMIGKKPIRKDKGAFTKGTEIKINYTNNSYDKISWIKEIKFFVKTCTTKCVIRLNGEELTKLDARGTKKEYDLCTLRVNKSKADYNAGYGNMSEYCQIFIRIGGITMFRRFISTQIPALVTLDLKVGDVKNISLEMLNSSRESLQWKYQNAFDRVIEEILVNPRTIVSRNDDLIKIDKYAIAEVERIKQQLQKQIEAELKKEEEEIQKQEDAAQTASDYMDIDERKAELEEKRELKEEEIQAVGRFIETTVRGGDKYDIESRIRQVEKINPAVGKMLRMTIDNRYTSDMGYTFVVHKHGDKKPAIDPKSEKAQTILHSWKLVVDKLMQKFHSDTKYVVGLTFDPDAKAKYVPDFDGECHILINPTSAPKFTDAVNLGHWIYIQATHEVTHNSASYHNEDFTIRWGTLLEEMSKNPNDWINLFRKAKQESDVIMKKRKQAV